MVNKDLEGTKYVVFSATKSKPGTDHVFRFLNTVFIEAIRWRRIPAVGKFSAPRKHNHGVMRDDLRFDNYLDLSKGTLRKRKRVDHIIEDRQQWIPQESLDLTSYGDDTICRIKDEVISLEMHENYDVIIREDPSLNYIKNYFKQVPPEEFFLDFPYSQKVNQLTDLVLDAFGSSRQAAWAAQCFFLNKVATMRSCFDDATRARGSSIGRRKPHYVCLQVPANKNQRLAKGGALSFSITQQQIQEVLSYAISKRSRIYIMSYIRDPQYFDFLKKDYLVYRYYDFPELNQLISGEGGQMVDNVMLYLVEKNIMKYATVKIFPPYKGSMMCHTNEIYNMSMLKNPPNQTKYSKNKQ